MAKLAQAYIHLRPYELTQGRLNELGPATELVAREVAQRVYQIEVTLDVLLEGGSLWVRITVVGSIFLTVYGAIADYKGFKDSISELCKDAREFGYDVCGEVLKLTGASEKQILRVEKRTMTPGRLSRVIQSVEKLKTESTVDALQRDRELTKILRELRAIRRDLTPQEAELLEKVFREADFPLQLPNERADIPRVGLTRTELDDFELALLKSRKAWREIGRSEPNKVI